MVIYRGGLGRRECGERGPPGRGYDLIADSVHCTAETNTTFIIKQLYCNFKKR